MRPGRRTGFICLVLAVSFFPACSLRLTGSDRLPAAAKLYAVSPYQQEPEQCGPYALAALLGHAGIEADAERLARKLHSPGARGTLTLDLFLEARRRGLDAQQVSGTLELLVRELEGSGPVILLLRYPGLAGGGGHFILVTGYSSDPGGYFLLWGDGKLSWMGSDHLRRLWSGSGFWMLRVRGEKDL